MTQWLCDFLYGIFMHSIENNLNIDFIWVLVEMVCIDYFELCILPVFFCKNRKNSISNGPAFDSFCWIKSWQGVTSAEEFFLLAAFKAKSSSFSDFMMIGCSGNAIKYFQLFVFIILYSFHEMVKSIYLQSLGSGFAVVIGGKITWLCITTICKRPSCFCCGSTFIKSWFSWWIKVGGSILIGRSNTHGNFTVLLVSFCVRRMVFSRLTFDFDVKSFVVDDTGSFFLQSMQISSFSGSDGKNPRLHFLQLICNFNFSLDRKLKRCVGWLMSAVVLLTELRTTDWVLVPTQQKLVFLLLFYYSNLLVYALYHTGLL